MAGITRMFPNDGFLVSTTLARTIGYRPMSEVGHACDTDFGIRLCAAARDVWFLDEFTLKYRASAESISKYATVTPYTYDMLSALEVPPDAAPALAQAKRNIAPSALSGFARLGRTHRALGIYLSADYPVSEKLSFRGIYHLALILKSLFQSPVAETRRSLDTVPAPSQETS